MMKLRAMTILVIFVGILYLPFAVNAASGKIFNGVPKPDLSILGASQGGSGQDGANSSASQYAGAGASQYGAGAAQYSTAPQAKSEADIEKENYAKLASKIDVDYMRNHMNRIKEDGISTKVCATCHTSRADFCDKCHSFAGVNPQIDF